MRPLVDAHLDLAWNATSFDRDLTLSLGELNGAEAKMTDAAFRGKATTTFPEMRRGHIQVCLGTLLARSGPQHQRQSTYKRGELDFAHRIGAYAAAHAQLACYRLWHQQQEIRWIQTISDLDQHLKACDSPDLGTQPPGVILSMEGADPIVEPNQLQEWHAAGLRAIGLVHYGHGQYASGTAVDGPLTDAGRELLTGMSALGMGLDVTHLCDLSMRQALDCFDGPVWASHHNCRALVPGDRQLPDEMIKLIIERDGVIGAACDAWMLKPGWVIGETTSEQAGVTLEHVADHIDHVCQLAGNGHHAAIGSDLDGGFGHEQTPCDLKSIADLQKLDAILQRRGYAEDEIERIFSRNWLRLFRRVLPAEPSVAPPHPDPLPQNRFNEN